MSLLKSVSAFSSSCAACACSSAPSPPRCAPCPPTSGPACASPSRACSAASPALDRRRGAAETRVAPQPDFDEDERSGVEHHQIEFAEGIARVALKQSQPRFLQQGAGGVFRRRTRGLAVNAQARPPCAARVPAPDADGRR